MLEIGKNEHDLTKVDGVVVRILIQQSQEKMLQLLTRVSHL